MFYRIIEILSEKEDLKEARKELDQVQKALTANGVANTRIVSVVINEKGEVVQHLAQPISYPIKLEVV